MTHHELLELGQESALGVADAWFPEWCERTATHGERTASVAAAGTLAADGAIDEIARAVGIDAVA